MLGAWLYRGTRKIQGTNADGRSSWYGSRSRGSVEQQGACLPSQAPRHRVICPFQYAEGTVPTLATVINAWLAPYVGKVAFQRHETTFGEMRINFVALSFRSVMMSPKRRKPDIEADNTVLYKYMHTQYGSTGGTASLSRAQFPTVSRRYPRPSDNLLEPSCTCMCSISYTVHCRQPSLNPS
jgi:hypothetical protein